MKKRWVVGIILVLVIIFVVAFTLLVVEPIESVPEKAILGAHRGNSVDYMENTLPAFESAIKEGKYKFIEFDVQYTKDKVLVVHHDKSLLRLQQKTEKIPDLTYAELENLSDYHIPTYLEVMEIVAGKKPLNVEIKSQGNFEDDREIADFLIRDLEERGILNSSLISSISQETIFYINQRYNNFKGAWEEDYSNNNSYWQNEREIDTGIIFYVTKSAFTDRFAFFVDIFSSVFRFARRDYGFGMVKDTINSGANHLMVHGINIRQYNNLYVSFQYDERVVFWTFDDKMYLVLPEKYHTNKIEKEVKVWWED